MEHKTFYKISNESDSNENHYDTLSEAKSAIYSSYTKNERLKYFGENHTSMIEKFKYNKKLGEYDVTSYTGFVETSAGTRFFKTCNNYGDALMRIKEFLYGVI